jgi:phosphoglycolate phosphatase-like HAD superfamily hydrolase
MVRLVLFDIDGTLIVSGGAGGSAFGRVCATVFHVPDGLRGVQFAGRTDRGIVREFFTRHGISPTEENFARFFDAYVFWLDHLLGCCPGRVLPGVEALLGGLRALPEPPVIGLLTGNIRLGAEIKLNHFRLWRHFTTGTFGDDHEDRNQLARLALERGSRILKRALKGEEVLVIGDTPLDIHCARAIQAKVLAVATGTFTIHQLRAHTPNWALEDLRQVVLEEVCG